MDCSKLHPDIIERQTKSRKEGDGLFLFSNGLILFESGGGKGSKTSTLKLLRLPGNYPDLAQAHFLGFYPEEKYIKSQPFPTTALETKLLAKDYRLSLETEMIIDPRLLFTSSTVSVQTFLWKLGVSLARKLPNSSETSPTGLRMKPARSNKRHACYFLK